MKKLFCDLGHSIKYPGAAGIKTEVQWNRAIWMHLRDLLDKKKLEIVLVPDVFLTDYSSNRNLVNRISFINKRSKPTDLLLSIPGNAAANARARGVTTCYMGGSESARIEAAELSKIYAETTGVPVWNGGAFDDRSGRFGRIGMVRDSTPFALLIEAGFVTNEKDMNVDAKMAANAIAKYYNHFS
jgi:N-acetylmuramoyl-L-alanine amidase